MTPTILVVDDSPVNREICRRSLQGSFEVIEAESGEKALEVAKAQMPHLILLDIMMSGIDGFEVLEQLNNNEATRGIPVLFLTAKGEIKDKLRGFKLGAEDYITKPFDRLELIARVETRLRKRMEEERRVTEARSKVVSQLLITLSHHINNSLTILLGHMQLINPENPETVKRTMNIIKQQTDRIRVVMEVLYETAEKLELKTMDDVGRKDYLFDIREELQRRLDSLKEGGNTTDWK